MQKEPYAEPYAEPGTAQNEAVAPSSRYLQRVRELATALRDLGALAEPVAVDATRTDVLCHEVLRLTETAHALAAEVLAECQI